MSKKQMKKIRLKKVHHGARLTEGGGSKAICAMPIWNQDISNRGFLKADLSFIIMANIVYLLKIWGDFVGKSIRMIIWEMVVLCDVGLTPGLTGAADTRFIRLVNIGCQQVLFFVKYLLLVLLNWLFARSACLMIDPFHVSIDVLCLSGWGGWIHEKAICIQHHLLYRVYQLNNHYWLGGLNI